MNSSILCACSIDPGPQTTVLIPNSWNKPAGLFQELGISTVVCGPGSIEQAHKIDEFIELNEMKKCLKFLEGVKDKSVN